MTRMLVPSRGMSDGVPTGCTGVTMEDGTVYRANRAGHMNIEDPAHVAAMLRNGDGFIADQKFAAVQAPGVSCTTCGFSGFKFHLSAPCPRCGGEMADQGGATQGAAQP